MSKRLIAVLLLLVLPPVLEAEVTILLEPKSHEGYEIRDGKIYFRKGSAGMILEPVGNEAIARYYSERGSQLGNPFSNLGGDMQQSTIFLLTLLNRTNGNLTFTPRYVTMKIRTEAYFPMDFTVLLQYTEGLDSYTQQVLQKSVFHQPELVQPGKVVSKFLIFPALPKKFDDVTLEFDYLYFESSELKPHFFFTRKK